MISNRDDEVKTQSINLELNDFSLWESGSEAVNNFIRSYSFDITNLVMIYILGFFLVISAVLGFGFFLWYLKSSNEQTQSQLLNILYSYFSATCITCSPAVFSLILTHKYLPEHELERDEHAQRIGRVTATHFIAVSVLFLLISFATVLNPFKPGVYLDVSLNWRHKIAIPVMVVNFILIEQTIHASCHQQKKNIQM